MTRSTRSTLDRRRSSLQARRSAAEASAAKVAVLDEQLNSNAVQTQELEANLQVALDRVAGLKKALKASKRTRTRLRDERKTARRDDAEIRQRADAAEAKYDRAVLADMLRREKDRDLSDHAVPRTPAGSEPTAEPTVAAPVASLSAAVSTSSAQPAPAVGDGSPVPPRTGTTRSTARSGTRAAPAGRPAASRARGARTGDTT